MELLDIKHAAAELDIAVVTLRLYCQQGRIGTKVGTQWVITRTELEAFKAMPRLVGRPRKGEDGG